MSAAVTKDAYEVKKSESPLEEAQVRLMSGKYAILSWDALDALLREDNPTEFNLTSELVARCSFIAKEAFGKSSDEFGAAVMKPKGIVQTSGADKRSGLLEEIKLKAFLETEHFLTDETRVFVSEDLIGDLSKAITDQFLEKCVFVAKEVFDPKIKKKYELDLNDGQPFPIKANKLSTAIRNMIKFKQENQKNQIVLMYSISALKA